MEPISREVLEIFFETIQDRDVCNANRNSYAIHHGAVGAIFNDLE